MSASDHPVDHNAEALSQLVRKAVPDGAFPPPVFVYQSLALFVNAGNVRLTDFKPGQSDTSRRERSGTVLLVAADSIVQSDYAITSDGAEVSAFRGRPQQHSGSVAVLVRRLERPRAIRFVGSVDEPLPFLKAESLTVTFASWELALPLSDKADGVAYVRDLQHALATP
jgi:hypothetical protein